MTIAIYLKPHLKKYIRQFLKDGNKITITTSVGIVLRALLKEAPPNYYPSRNVNSELIILDLGRDKTHLIRHYLTKRKEREFNEYLDERLEEEFMMVMKTECIDHGRKYATVIREFLSKYRLKEEELSFDALKKRWQRSDLYLETRATAA